MESNPLSKALVYKKMTLPKILDDLSKVSFEVYKESKNSEQVQKTFPETSNKPYIKLQKKSDRHRSLKKVGVLFSGGQAPGGHNVIWGLSEALLKLHPNLTLIGFLGGPSGFIQKKYIELSKEEITPFHNLGGFNMIGSGRDKIETLEDLEKAKKTAEGLQLDGLVIIGGDDSNTNAAILAEYFKNTQCKTSVIGVPKTIDGDLQNEYVNIPFGFDTACKLYSELVGNILTDALSSKKYYHFIKLMGRSASHVTLEVGLQTQPNLILIGEEIRAKKITLDQIVDQISNLIIKRFEVGKNFGVILIPEGLVDFIPSFEILNQEINTLLANNQEKIEDQLSVPSKELFQSLPKNIRDQLLMERDPHGNIQLAKINTQDLLIEMAQERLKKLQFKGKFSPVSHYFGYEGRASNPSPFDAEYTFSLGYCAALLLHFDYSGYMACIRGLKNKAKKWDLYGLPITSFLNFENRHGKEKPVIAKALVDLNSQIFHHFQEKRDQWLFEDLYNAPGPIQYFGDDSLCNTRNFTLNLR